MECDLIISAVSREGLQITRENQAMKKAKRKIQYLQGTMSLEKQDPDQALLRELMKDEVKNLLESSGSELWDDE